MRAGADKQVRYPRKKEDFVGLSAGAVAGAFDSTRIYCFVSIVPTVAWLGWAVMTFYGVPPGVKNFCVLFSLLSVSSYGSAVDRLVGKATGDRSLKRALVPFLTFVPLVNVLHARWLRLILVQRVWGGQALSWKEMFRQVSHLEVYEQVDRLNDSGDLSRPPTVR